MQNGDSYNRGGYIAFVFSMVFSLAFMAYLAWMHPGIDLKEIPEEAMAEGAAAPAEGSAPAFDVASVENPWVSSDGMIAHGKKLFQQNCAACHGPSGAGDGPAGGALVPPPRNIIEGKWTKGGDEISLFKTLQAGISGTSMAAFGHLPVKDRWALVHFMRSITNNKVDIDPAQVEEFGKTAN